MFTKRELIAMAWGYSISVPLGCAALYFGSSLALAAEIFSLGFLVTLVKLNWDS